MRERIRLLRPPESDTPARKTPVQAVADASDEVAQGWPSPDMLTPAHIPALQRTYGNQAVQRLLRQGGPAAPGNTIQREDVDIGGKERLKVSSKLSDDEKNKQIKRAKEIIKEIKDNYGIKIDSQASLDAVLEDLDDDAPDRVRRKIKIAAWTLNELENLLVALKNYEPILGKNRKKNKNKDFAKSDQELKSIGKVTKAVSKNGRGTRSSTLATTFAGGDTIAIYSALKNSDKDFEDSDDQQQGTMSHELAHSLVQHIEMKDFLKAFNDYWADEDDNLTLGDDGESMYDPPAEAPITDYGATNAREDIGEIAKYYFEAPNKLKNGMGGKPGMPGNPAPRRFDFFDRVVLSWQNTPEQVHMKRFLDNGKGFLKLAPGADKNTVNTRYWSLENDFNQLNAKDQAQARDLWERVKKKYATFEKRKDWNKDD